MNLQDPLECDPHLGSHDFAVPLMRSGVAANSLNRFRGDEGILLMIVLQ